MYQLNRKSTFRNDLKNNRFIFIMQNVNIKTYMI